MAKKSIGQFISALRKANGMTQKQLAERLNVSDKAVSRWERDESAPDLSLIPVIAEIFGVTSDEILRGERRIQDYEDFTPQNNAKSEKQIEHLTSDTRTKLIIRSIIAVSIGFLGLLSAMICNFGFYRAGLGFLISCIFYLIAAVCEASFFILAVNSVKTGGFDGENINRCKKSLLRAAVWAFTIIFFLLSVSIPFIENGFDFFGILLEEWLIKGAIYGIICVIICSISSAIVYRIAIKQGFYTISEKEKKMSDKILKLKKNTAIILAVMLALTFAIHGIYNGILYQIVWEKVGHGREFTDLAEFKIYIETDEPPIDYSEYGLGYYTQEEYMTEIHDDEYFYEDESESADYEINYDDYETYTIEAPDGTVLCEYKNINTNVLSISVKYSGDNATVITYNAAEAYRANRVTEAINYCIIALYFIEAVAVIIGYNVKKYKIIKN